MFQRQFALKNISFRQSKLAFEIERRQDLSMQDDVFDVRRVLGNRINDGIAKFFSFVVPISFLQIVRSVLHEARHHVLARRSD